MAHAPVHCPYDEDVLRLGFTVQQGGGGNFTCRREGCVREGLGGPGRDWGRRERAGVQKRDACKIQWPRCTCVNVQVCMGGGEMALTGERA